MPRGMYRSRTFRRVFVRTPGSRTVIHYRERKPAKAKCGKCSKALAGVPRERPAVMRNLPLSSKRPTRPYGGRYCSACTRALLKEQARGEPA